MADEMNRNEDRYAREMAADKQGLRPSNIQNHEMSVIGGSPLVNAGSNTSSRGLISGNRVGGRNGGMNDNNEQDDNYDELEGGLGENTFHHPALYRNQPTIWLPKDSLGLSSEAVQNARARGIDITDQEADINDKGKLEIYRDTVPGLDFSKS